MKKLGTTHAFTLIEVLTVIIIIAVMAGIVVPDYYRFYQGRRFDEQTHKVEDFFASARRQAIALDETVTVQYNANSHALEANIPPPLPAADMPEALQQQAGGGGRTPSVPTTKTVALGENYQIISFQAQPQGSPQSSPGQAGAGGSQSAKFYGDGTSDSATLTVEDNRGDSASYTLLPATGELKSMDGNGNAR